MNPFDLAGPQFLFFYLALIAAVAFALLVARRVCELGPIPKLPSVDPYLVAYLRGGAAEAVRVCTLALMDRKLFKIEDDALTALPRALEQVRRPLERAIVQALRVRRAAYELVVDEPVLHATRALRDELQKLELVPGARDKLRRTVLGMIAIAGLWLVAATKIAIAFSRGRHNVGFLIVLALGSVVIVVLVLLHARTERGDRLLRDLRELFVGLRERVKLRGGQGADQELALLIAVYGLEDAPASLSARVKALFPKAKSGNNCGSSCSSSSSSSCGSSCGGGGGCGGCGS